MNSIWAQIGQKISRFFLWAMDEHPGKLIGTTTGFLIGLFTVTIGFWRALILFLFLIGGFIVGKRHDDHKGLLKWLERFFEK